jgi:hypothetical protein
MTPCSLVHIPTFRMNCCLRLHGVCIYETKWFTMDIHQIRPRPILDTIPREFNSVFPSSFSKISLYHILMPVPTSPTQPFRLKFPDQNAPRSIFSLNIPIEMPHAASYLEVSRPKCPTQPEMSHVASSLEVSRPKCPTRPLLLKFPDQNAPRSIFSLNIPIEMPHAASSLEVSRPKCYNHFSFLHAYYTPHPIHTPPVTT